LITHESKTVIKNLGGKYQGASEGLVKDVTNSGAATTENKNKKSFENLNSEAFDGYCVGIEVELKLIRYNSELVQMVKTKIDLTAPTSLCCSPFLRASRCRPTQTW
jgi:hypothetical protein